MAVSIMRAFCIAVIASGIGILVAAFFAAARAANTCDGFISASCCCTTGACFVIPRSEIIRLDETRYRIVRTGEIVEAKGASPDGQVRRCTYDHDHTGFVRIGHPDAKTSCLYVTETGS